MKKIALASLLFLGGTSIAAAADGPANMDYGYFQLGYMNATLDVGVDVDLSGFGFEGNIPMGQSAFITVGLQDLGGDYEGIDIDARDKFVGFGGAWAVSSATDFYLAGKYLISDGDIEGFGSFDDSGFGVDFGFRGQTAPGFELFGEVNYVKYDAGTDTGFTVGAKMGPGFFIQYQTADDVDAYMIGWRIGG